MYVFPQIAYQETNCDTYILYSGATYWKDVISSIVCLEQE